MIIKKYYKKQSYKKITDPRIRQHQKDEQDDPVSDNLGSISAYIQQCIQNVNKMS